MKTKSKINRNNNNNLSQIMRTSFKSNKNLKFFSIMTKKKIKKLYLCLSPHWISYK